MCRDEFLVLFKNFIAKAGCHHTQYKANQLWNKLKIYLSDKEQVEISIARSHYLTNWDRGEIDYVCNPILQKYYKNWRCSCNG